MSRFIHLKYEIKYSNFNIPLIQNKNIETLTTIIDFLKTDKADTSISYEDKIVSLRKIQNLVDELKIKRSSFLNENVKELRQKITSNYKKLRISALSLMEYRWNENSHSNILEYLIDYNSFEDGVKVLCQIINDSATLNKDALCNKILKQSYTVDREYTIISGRIDLFVFDKVEKFVIIIENKILAGISETIGEEENSISITQLEKYEKWCNENYADYIRLYILLNFSNNDDNTSLFDKVSYGQLYDNLNNLNSTDNILEEYLLLLNTLLNPVAQDLFKIKKLANKIMKNENQELSLTDYYTLKTIFYA